MTATVTPAAVSPAAVLPDVAHPATTTFTGSPTDAEVKPKSRAALPEARGQAAHRAWMTMNPSIEGLGKPPTADDDSPEKWAKLLAGAVLDAIERRRDVRGLARWIRRDVFRRLYSQYGDAPLILNGAGPSRPNGARTWMHGPDVAEVAVTLWDGDRLRAVSLRLERKRVRWIVTAIEAG